MKEQFLSILIVFGHMALWCIPCNALTPEQVVALKKAGVEDRTIQMMIRQEEAAKARGGEGMGVVEIRDKDGRVTTVYSTGAPDTSLSEKDRANLDRAWDMLKHVIIDGRQ